MLPDLLLALVLVSATPTDAVASDSVALRSEARDAQTRFERVRVFRAPLGHGSAGGRCDEIVGRFCLRFTGTSEDERNPPWRPPPEHEAVVEARAELDATLARIAAELPADGWVAGQRVFYRAEVRDWEGALEAARACRSPDPGWCDLLEGLAYHGGGDAERATRAFDEALAALSEEARAELLELDALLERDLRAALQALPERERAWLEARIWLVGSPLFLAGPHALRNEHLARHVLARTRAEARNPHGLRWGNDLTELMVRFGPVVGWERVREPVGLVSGPTLVSGRYSWDPKGIFPRLGAVMDPASASAEDFPAAFFQARSRHATPTFPRIRGMEARTTRFRRGAALDSLLVVAAWRIPPPPSWDTVPPRSVDVAALFLLEEARGSPERFDGTPGETGVVMARVARGGWWLSLEVADEAGGRAWRHREGVRGEPLAPGRLALSDLLLLEPEEEEALPGPDDRLENHLHRALPSDSLAGRRVELAWEVYGLPEDPGRLRFMVGVEREERGLFRRAGEALRLVSPLEPVEIRWEEGVVPVTPGGNAPDAHRPPSPPASERHFRRVTLDLSTLSPGAWTVRVRLEGEDPLPGQGEATAATRVVVR